VNLLLDTHAFIWMLEAPEKLSKKVIEAYQDAANTLYVSVASLWEIQIKTANGKLEMEIPLTQLVREQLQGERYRLLDIQAPHVLELNALPRLHGDPFDRVLMAQSRVERFPLVSIDGVFDQYPVERFW
jgi:PIN domain nuclease of toxin-antitoxin system